MVGRTGPRREARGCSDPKRAGPWALLSPSRRLVGVWAYRSCLSGLLAKPWVLSEPAVLLARGASESQAPSAEPKASLEASEWMVVVVQMAARPTALLAQRSGV